MQAIAVIVRLRSTFLLSQQWLLLASLLNKLLWISHGFYISYWNFVLERTSVLILIHVQKLVHYDYKHEYPKLRFCIFTSAENKQAHLMPSGSSISNSKKASCLSKSANIRSWVDSHVRRRRLRIELRLSGILDLLQYSSKSWGNCNSNPFLNLINLINNR